MSFMYQMGDMDQNQGGDIHLTYEEVKPYLGPDPVNADPNIVEYLKSIKKKSVIFRINRINAMYNDLQQIWPEGSPIEYYVGYELYQSLSEEAFLDEIKNQEVIEKIECEVSMRKKGINNKNSQIKDTQKNRDKYTESNSTFLCGDDSEDEDYHNEYQSKKNKKNSSWTPKDTSKLIRILSAPNEMRTWRIFAKAFKNKTADQVFQFYKEMLSKKLVTSKYAPKKDFKSKKKNSKGSIKRDLGPFQHIQGLFLVRGDQRSVIGPQSDSMKEYARNNPLFGCIDLITYEKMFVPAISSHGSVLDYDTWMKVINDTQTDPLEMQPVNTKRQITILTPENIEKFRPQIRNMDSMSKGLTKG